MPDNETVQQAIAQSQNQTTIKTEDLVDQDKLKLLDESPELKQILSNEHLRNLLKKINETSEKSIDFQMDQAMQEPLFTEFADVCLKIVQNKTDLSEINHEKKDFKMEDLIN